MPTTSNFGWTTPADTDLVKDGALAIRTLGNGIDTSMAELKGGTTGQILSKTSNTDMDFTWINNDQGDITAVNVTSPITGGGTSGSVTVGIQDATTAQKGAVQLENSTSSTSTTTAAVPANVKSAYDLANAAIPKSTVTTNGDLIYGTGSSTVTRLGIGSSDQVLTVSGGVPTWVTPTTSNAKLGQVLSATKTDTFTTTSSSFTDITGLSVTITPSSTSSKILIFANVVGASTQATSGSKAMVRLVRGTTAISVGDAVGSAQQASGYLSTRSLGTNTIAFTSTTTFLDSPATTSATTYKVQGIVGAGTMFVNRDEEGDTSSTSGRFVSSITVIEVLP